MSDVVHKSVNGNHHRLKTMNFLLEGPIAHRGLFDQTYPENSVGAFIQATKAGFVSELDVQVTRDGYPVVFHDEDLARMTGQTGKIADFDLKQLKTLHLNQTSAVIPTLSEVIQAISEAKGLLIEIKSAPHMASVSRLVWRTMQNTPFPWAVESFNPLALLWYAWHVPQLPRGILIAHNSQLHPLQKLVLSPGLIRTAVQPDFFAYDLRSLPNPYAQSLRKQGKPVISWTIRTAQEWQKAKYYSDNLIFDTIWPPKAE